MKRQELSVEAVIFDMDGVITNTMYYHYVSWKKILSRRNIHISKYAVYKAEGQPGDQFLEDLFDQLNMNISQKEIGVILKEKEADLKDTVKIRFIAGARTFLKNLKKKGFKLGLVTGTSYDELVKILPSHLLELFSVVVTGCLVKKGKPHPDPFLKAIKELKIKKNQSVVIENAPFGILSAKRAGLKCIALETSLKKSYLTRADFIFSNIKEMQSKLAFNYNG